MRALSAAAVICATIFPLAGCAVFEEPSIVLDLRVLGMIADPPDQVVNVDITQPMVSEILTQLEDVKITALVADPNHVRQLRWSMTLCLVDDEGRCDLNQPYKDLGSAIIDDPEESESRQQPVAIVNVDLTYLQMLQRAIEANPVQALGGVDLTIMLRVGGIDDTPENDVLAAKKVRVSPNFPTGRKANTNPDILMLDAARPNGGPDVTIYRRRCSDPLTLSVAPTYIPAGVAVTLFPIERDGTREEYQAPTLDGQSVMVEETISYQWLAEYGSWSDETTGGGHDILGNQSLLGSDWTAPRSIPGNEFPVSIWVIQRDERLGVSVFETCIVVTP